MKQSGLYKQETAIHIQKSVFLLGTIREPRHLAARQFLGPDFYSHIYRYMLDFVLYKNSSIAYLHVTKININM